MIDEKLRRRAELSVFERQYCYGHGRHWTLNRQYLEHWPIGRKMQQRTRHDGEELSACYKTDMQMDVAKGDVLVGYATPLFRKASTNIEPTRVSGAGSAHGSSASS